MRTVLPRCILVAGLAAPGAIRGTWAQDASGYAELTAGRSDLQAEDSAGRRSDTRTGSFLQRYGFDLNWRLYPNLRVLMGGLFERDAASTSDDVGTLESTQRKIHPYLSALLRTAIFSGQVGVYRNEDTLQIDGSSTSNIQEIYNSTLGWRPKAMPSVTVRFIRTNTIGADRRTQDTTDDLIDLVSEYQPVDSVQIYYRGAYDNFDDRLQDLNVRRTTQSARVTYADAWWDQRVQFGAEYNVNARTSDVTVGGGGDVVAPLFPIGGLSLITDLPLSGALTPNPALIDDDKTAGAGVNIGLQPLGGDERPRNIGLDLGDGSTLDTLFVWVDRQIPATISGSFSWDIYTSSDNLIWVLRQTVVPAPFGTFDNRFEIQFNEVTARYIKVVTPPLARTVPTADRFPDILITEISAALRTPAADARGRTSQTTELLTSSLRARLSGRPAVYYELTYFARQVGSLPTTYTLSNGISMRHAFNPVMSVAGRLAREDSHETEGSRDTYLYTASMRAVPLPTLQHSIVVSGRSSTIEGRSSEARSVYVYNTAELYRGINVNLGLGSSSSKAEGGLKTEATQVNAVATLVPHRTTTLNLLYQINDSTRSGASAPTRQRIKLNATQASVTYRPVSTLYFFFSYRLEDDNRTQDRFLRNYSVSWSPYPDGSLQILMRFDESHRSDLQSLSRIYSPRVRWNITDRWYIEAAYEKSIFDSAVELRQTDAYTANMRIWF